MVEITTARVRLRRARETDAAPLWEVFSNREAMKYWSTLPHPSPTHTAELVAGMIALAADAPYFVVEHAGRPIGTAGFWQGNEVGFILHPDAWGQGIGSELLAGLIAHGFGVCGFDSITADVDPDNVASIALLSSKGFTETGRAKATLRLGATWVDSIYFALTRATWEDR